MLNNLINFLNKNKINNIQTFNNNIMNTDCIIIGTGMSKIHIKAVSKKLTHYAKMKYNIKNIIIAGENTDWIVIDYSIFIIHIMIKVARLKYNIEDLLSNNDKII